MHKQTQAGFTLVELVIVIVLLGLLAVTAFPRYLDVTDQAQTASVKGVAGGLASGVAIFKGQWTADGNSSGTEGAVVTLDGETFIANENGWPTQLTAGGDETSDGGSTDECEEVFNFIMQNPPATHTTGPIGASDEYSVSVQNNNPDLCRYELIVNGAIDIDNRFFDYNLANGQVTLSLP
jgi:MSHA pilin protein MshB